MKRLNLDERRKVWRSTNAAATAFNVYRPLIFADSRSEQRVALARQTSMYLAHVTGQIPLNRLPLAFNRDISTIAHNVAVVEDLREHQSFDLLIEELQRYVRGDSSNIERWTNPRLPGAPSLAALEPVECRA